MIPHLISAAVFSNDLMSITSSIFIWYVILHNKYKPLQRELQGLSANSSEKGMLIDSQTDAQSFIYLRLTGFCRMVPILSFNLLLSIVLSCSINMIEFFDRPFPSASMATCVGRSALFFFDVIAATMMVGLYLFPTSFCTTRTGSTPPCSEPVTGLRSAK